MVVDANSQTEEYILQEEQYRIAWEKKYGCQRDVAYELMEKCLREKSPETKHALWTFFENKELVKELSQINDFAFMVVIMEIYAMELEAGVTNSVFEWSDNLQGLIDVIRQVKFLLWEIEFLDDEESGQLLLQYIQKMGISMTAFEYLVYITSYDKKKVIGYLNQLFS